MADWLQFIDDTLGTNFNAPVYDPAKGRKKLVRVIDTAAEQHRENKTPPTRSWKAGNQNAISFTPKIDGKPVLIRGKVTNYVPAEHFQAFLNGLKAAVEAGQLDKEIKATIEGSKPESTAATSTRAPRSRTGLGSKAQPDNPEWMARFVEQHGEAPGEGYVPNSKGSKWVKASYAARGQAAAATRHS